MLRWMLLFIACFAGGCTLIAARLFSDPAQWQAEVFTHWSFDDVFDVTVVQIKKEFAVIDADRSSGKIESGWDFNSVSPVTRYLRRERVVAQVTATEEGIELKLRVQTEVRERSGLLGPDDHSNVGWAQALDDSQRSEQMFQRVHSVLKPGGPSDSFYSRSLRKQSGTH